MVGAYAVYKYRGVHYVPAKYGALPTTAAAHVSAYKNQSSKKKREKKKKKTTDKSNDVHREVIKQKQQQQERKKDWSER